MSGVRSSTCPLRLVFGAAVALIVGAALLGRVRPDIPVLHNPAQTVLLVASFMACALEVSRLRGSDCPYLEKSALFRVPFYLSTTVVLFVVAVLVALARSALVLATTGSLLLSVGCGVWIHVRVDHSPSEFGAAPIWLVSLFRLAFVSTLVSGLILVVQAAR